MTISPARNHFDPPPHHQPDDKRAPDNHPAGLIFDPADLALPADPQAAFRSDATPAGRFAEEGRFPGGNRSPEAHHSPEPDRFPKPDHSHKPDRFPEPNHSHKPDRLPEPNRLPGPPHSFRLELPAEGMQAEQALPLGSASQGGALTQSERPETGPAEPLSWRKQSGALGDARGGEAERRSLGSLLAEHLAELEAERAEVGRLANPDDLGWAHSGRTDLPEAAGPLGYDDSAERDGSAARWPHSSRTPDGSLETDIEAERVALLPLAQVGPVPGAWPPRVAAGSDASLPAGSEVADIPLPAGSEASPLSAGPEAGAWPPRVDPELGSSPRLGGTDAPAPPWQSGTDNLAPQLASTDTPAPPWQSGTDGLAPLQLAVTDTPAPPWQSGTDGLAPPQLASTDAAAPPRLGGTEAAAAARVGGTEAAAPPRQGGTEAAPPWQGGTEVAAPLRVGGTEAGAPAWVGGTDAPAPARVDGGGLPSRVGDGLGAAAHSVGVVEGGAGVEVEGGRVGALPEWTADGVGHLVTPAGRKVRSRVEGGPGADGVEAGDSWPRSVDLEQDGRRESVADLAERLGDDVVDVADVVAELGRLGVVDDVGARARYGTSLHGVGVSVLTHLQHRRAQRGIRRAPSRRPYLTAALLRCALYLGPLSVAVAAASSLASVGPFVPAVVLVLGWSAAQAFTSVGAKVAHSAGTAPAARLVGGGFLAAGGVWGALVWVAPAALLGGHRMLSLTVGLGGLAALATVTAALVTRTEAAVVRWSLPCWLLGTLSVAGTLGDGWAARLPLETLLPAAIVVAAVRAYRPVIMRRVPDRPRLDRRDVRRGAGHLVLGAAQAGCLVLLWRAGPGLGALPLLIAVPALETLVGWHMFQVAAGLDLADSDRGYRQHVRSIAVTTVSALLPPLAAGIALAAAAYRLPDGVSTRDGVLALAAGTLLGGVLAITFLLAARGRTALAASLAAAAPLAIVGWPFLPGPALAPLPAIVAVLAATHLLGLLVVAHTAAQIRRPS